MSKSQTGRTQTGAKRAVIQNGFAIRDFREKDNLSRAELAEIVGMHPDALAHIENETRSTEKSTLIRIARAMAIRPASIMRVAASVIESDEEPAGELVA